MNWNHPLNRHCPTHPKYPKDQLAGTILHHRACQTLTFDTQNIEPWLLRFDGGVNGNGRMDATGRWAFMLFDPHGDLVSERSGHATGKPVTVNTCEWQGLVSGLEEAAKVTAIHALLIEGDSDLVISQLVGFWKVKTEPLREWREEALDWLVAVHAPWYARWIPRSMNADCDALTR